MQNYRHFKISDFDYELPDERIAKYPVFRRDQSKLLVYNNSSIIDDAFEQLPAFIPSSSVLVFNNTKVIPARLHFTKPTGALIEIFCLEPHLPKPYDLSLQSTKTCQWICLVGNAKRWKSGVLTRNLEYQNQKFEFSAEKVGEWHNKPIIEFSWNHPQLTFSSLIEWIGELPIPPYLNRNTEPDDLDRYQTVYSKIQGSVAAPTAGLHFTPDILEHLRQSGIAKTELTLHVGAGTFKPVQTESIAEHDMHSEHFVVTRRLIEDLSKHKFCIPVGTTSVRTLESIYWLAVQILDNKLDVQSKLAVLQWEPYQTDGQLNREAALQIWLNFFESQHITEIAAETAIMIVPGYHFKMIDALITNFHQPHSTLLLLVSALVGDKWKTIYQHALTHNYRFLSYGDSSLLFPEEK